MTGYVRLIATVKWWAVYAAMKDYARACKDAA